MKKPGGNRCRFDLFAGPPGHDGSRCRFTFPAGPAERSDLDDPRAEPN
jgi:hypothetical protein